MSKKFKFFFFFAFFLLFLILNSTSVSADIFWSTPEKINTSSNNAFLPAITTGPNGYLHTTWTEGEDVWIPNPGVFYSYWNGDAWSAPLKISQGTTNWAGYSRIAVTSDNHVHIVWEDDSENAANAWARVLYSEYNGSTWSTPISLSHDTAGDWAGEPQIVADAAGNLHLIYSNWADGGGTQVYYTKYTGSWSTPERLTVKGGSINEDWLEYSALAVDNANQPHVLMWEHGLTSSDPQIGIYHTYFNGSTWSTLDKISTNGTYPKIVVDNNNNLHAIWMVEWYDYPNQIYKNRVEYVRWNGSTWSSPYVVSTEAQFSYWYMPIMGVTYDSKNNVYVGWGEIVGWAGKPWKGVEIKYKKWNGSSWSNPVFMRKAYDMDNPFLYPDKWDNQHFAWTEQNETTQAWEFWYATVPVNAQSYNPASAFDMTLNITGDTLSIPAGALAQSATISAQIGPLPASADPTYTTLPRSFTYRPHGITFAAGKEATAVINYSDAEVIGTNEAGMKVYIWDGTLNAWSTSFTTSVNKGKNQATVTLPHFSLFGIMIPKAERNIVVIWKPPITVTKDETYTMVDGSTLPIKFSLTYEDGTPVPSPTSREDVNLIIRKTDFSEAFEYYFGTGADNIRYDKGANQYLFNLQTGELGLAPGFYNIKILYKNITCGTKDFQIVEKGKVKGVSTP